MATVNRLVLKNFKRFKTLELEFDAELNVLVGGNEAGKSTVLQALDLVLSASVSRVEALGIETLFNVECIKEFLKGERKLENLPELYAEVYLCGINDRPDLDGRNNSKRADQIGVRMICEPNDEYSNDIQAIISDKQQGSFPFEYYRTRFLGFGGKQISPYSKPLKQLLIDSSEISNEYATRYYTRSMYEASSKAAERNLHDFRYRKMKLEFTESVFRGINDAQETCKFDLRTGPKACVGSDVIITEGEIPIDSKGKGRQCFIKTSFAIRKPRRALDVLLLEEPENHLSHVHMHELVDQIQNSEKRQLFIATHSSFIATRLGLKKVLILSEEKPSQPASLRSLSQETANFFMKAPDNNLLELALCKKAILVEGDAEFILMDALYKGSAGTASAHKDGVHVISLDGTSFKRYFEIAGILGIKVAAIRDNDGDYQANCVENYSDFARDSTKVFADPDPARRTFEICMYQDNKDLCDNQFSASRRKLNVQDYMLKNKADAAFKLLDAGLPLVAPKYIKDAVTWIRA